MAYMSQEKKKRIASQLRLVVPKDWKYSLAIRNHSTIVCTIISAPIPQMNGTKHVEINPFGQKKDLTQFGELPAYTISKILEALNLENFDKSDIQFDYFEVGHHVALQFGRWDKPFIDTSPTETLAEVAQ